MASIEGKALRELSDAELDAELQRRRRARGVTAPHTAETTRGKASPPRREGTAPGWRVRQWYRDLELEPGASLADVEAAYQRLMARFDPEKHKRDPEKLRLAKRLVTGLGEAYYGLRDHLREG